MVYVRADQILPEVYGTTLIILNIQQTISDVTFNSTSLVANPTEFSQPFC
jgi:type II secretory pathway component GspD/PulD (secretin)